MGRAEILDKLGKQGDATAAVAVSNALVKLRSIGEIELDEASRKYRYVKMVGNRDQSE